MYSCDFKSKLARLNSRLFVDDTSKRSVTEDLSVSALCIRNYKRSDPMNYNQLVGDARKYAEASDAGMLPEHICGVPTSQIPEHDIYDLDKGKLLARGWRSVLMILHKKGLISLDKARRVFGCPSLAEATYDKVDQTVRLKWARDERFYKSAKEELAQYAE